LRIGLLSLLKITPGLSSAATWQRFSTKVLSDIVGQLAEFNITG